MPRTLCPCKSAPRLIASRAAAMSPRLMASNNASVGSMSSEERLAGAEARFLASAPGKAGGGTTWAGGGAADRAGEPMALNI